MHERVGAVGTRKQNSEIMFFFPLPLRDRSPRNLPPGDVLTVVQSGSQGIQEFRGSKEPRNQEIKATFEKRIEELRNREAKD